MKLWRVDGHIVVMVAVEGDQVPNQNEMAEAIHNELQWSQNKNKAFRTLACHDIERVSQIPREWKHSRPWGDEVPVNATCLDILEGRFNVRTE